MNRVFLNLLFFLMLGVGAHPQQSSSSSSQQEMPTIGAAPSSVIVPPPPNYRFPDDQTYVYAVEWHMFTAGTARVGLTTDGKQQHVTSTAASAGVANVLFRVNDRFEAYFDPHSFCSLRVEKHIEEGQRSRESDLHIEYARGKGIFEEKNLKTGEQKHVVGDVPGCVTDVVTGFYYLASLPLQVGNVNTFAINDGGKTTEVSARVEAREQVKALAGTFETVRVKIEANSGAMKGKGTVWAWFTDDGNHTPVQMRSKLGWGTLLFRLQRIEK
jgi:Protein of unknown function (DUF3108)